MLKAKITAKLETSDHDGYCSDEDCEYEVKTVSYIVDLPDQYNSYPEGKIKNINQFDNKWINLLPEPELNGYGSMYCCVSDECEAHGLYKHDYKYTILSVEIINSDSVNKNNEYVEKLDMKKIFSDD
jgi:hypothetical protein